MAVPTPTVQLGGSVGWPTKVGGLLAVNDNTNFRPVKLDPARNSAGWRINSSGLWERKVSDYPRIMFDENAEGQYINEESRTNNIRQSNQFDTTWLNQLGGTITGGQTNPLFSQDDAWLITKDAAVSRSLRQAITLGSDDYVYSFHVKAGTLSFAQLRVDAGASTIFVRFDLSDGSVESSSGTFTSSGSVNLGNGWYRCWVSFTDSLTNVHIYPDSSTGSTAGNILIQRAQLESTASYISTYIKTEGSAVTRAADSLSGTINTELIGQSEGTFFFDASAFDGLNGRFSLSDGTADNRLFFVYGQNDFELFVGGVKQCDLGVTITSTDRNLLAFTYKNNEFKAFANGAKESDQIGSGSTFPASTLNEFQAAAWSGSAPFRGRANCIAWWTSALTEAQAIELTTNGL